MSIPVGGDVLLGARVGDEIRLCDARRRRRRLIVTGIDADGSARVETDRTIYFHAGGEIERWRGRERIARGTVGPLPERERFLSIQRGESLRVQRNLAFGIAAQRDAEGRIIRPATIGCQLETVFDAVDVGHRVLIDDGTIEGVVEEVDADGFVLTVLRPERAKIKAEKGINLPDTVFDAPALTDEDRAALIHIAPLADLVSLSFVRSVDDVMELRQALDDLGRPGVGIGLKIEHRAGFEAMPQLLLYALQRPPMAVMLARGDLPVGVGFGRMAEVQEQVLWLCEAAHIPVIWATQVAESMAKQGVPTRAEITDAAWASRAECVMLNKGPHITNAIRFLDDVFQRMHDHQDKSTSLLRRLGVSDALSVAHAPTVEPWPRGDRDRP